MAAKTIRVNRAPVLTLWAAIVAQRLGFDEDEALTLGKAVAGLNAQSKGRRLGFFKPHEEKAKKAREKERGERLWIELLGRLVPATVTEKGIRAVRGSTPINPDSVGRYLEAKFGDDLKAVRKALESLAQAYNPEELAEEAYLLYERFRPTVPEGAKGWGAKGELDLALIHRLAKEKGLNRRGRSVRRHVQVTAALRAGRARKSRPRSSPARATYPAASARNGGNARPGRPFSPAPSPPRAPG
jgi:hypothetical protein